MKERIQKLMAQAGLCSRRAAEQIIRAGGVTVNGEKVTDVNAPLPASPFTLFKGKKVRLRVIVG